MCQGIFTSTNAACDTPAQASTCGTGANQADPSGPLAQVADIYRRGRGERTLMDSPEGFGAVASECFGAVAQPWSVATSWASNAGPLPNSGVREAVVPNEVRDQVQTVLGARRSAVDATPVHGHYLKGAVFCGRCGSRLLGCNAKSGQGAIYPCFVCASRHGGRGDCARRAMLIEQVQRLVERFCAQVQTESETTGD